MQKDIGTGGTNFKLAFGYGPTISVTAMNESSVEPVKRTRILLIPDSFEAALVVPVLRSIRKSLPKKGELSPAEFCPHWKALGRALWCSSSP
jgi:hypothetical protein